MYKLKRLLNKTISTKNTYLLAVVIFSFLLLVAYFSYAMFTVSKEKSGVLNIIAGSLQSYIESENGLERETNDLRNELKVEVNANEYKEVIITMTNFNSIKANFNLSYKNQSGVTIGYTSDSQTKLDNNASITIEPPKDGIPQSDTNQKKIKILIDNDNNENKTIIFTSKAGLENSTIEKENDETLINKLYNLSTPSIPTTIKGMIPVSYNSDKSSWVKVNNDDWYNYKNSVWANAVMINNVSSTNSISNIDGTTSNCESTCTRNDYINAKAGSIINTNDINSMYVWIPKYEYKYTNLSNTASLIKINFTTSNTASNNYKIPSAFNGNSGFWVSKYKASGSDNNVKFISNQAIISKSNLSDAYNSIINIKNTNNDLYGIDNSESFDINILKNDEWGAIAYLSQSYVGNYYKNRNEIFNNNTTTTGCSSGSPSASAGTCQYTYSSENGVKASTTGTIYGVYDMNGGLDEMVMATSNTANNDYFNNLESLNTANYNLYTNDISKACNNAICYSHALSETSNWYNDNNEFLTSEKTWLTRGGSSTDGQSSGIFSYKAITLGSKNISYRAVIKP